MLYYITPFTVLMHYCHRRALRLEAGKLWDHAKDRQKTKLLLQSNALQRKIDAWYTYQLLYCPAVGRLRAMCTSNTAEPTERKPYEIPLWLPSQIKGQVPVNPHLQEVEWKLRHSQVYKALERLRSQLQVQAHLYSFKDCFVRGQGANTRARNCISVLQAKIDATTDEYRVAHKALVSLGTVLLRFGWKNELLPLEEEDVRDISDGLPGESEGKRTMSWIWRKCPHQDSMDSNVLCDSKSKILFLLNIHK